MAYQDLLSKDYRKTPFKELVRFLIIFGNVAVFYMFSGWNVDGYLGPQILMSKRLYGLKAPDPRNANPIGDDLRFTSIIDLVGVIISVYLTIKQLGFGRPEIDSYNEIIYLPAQEKKVALLQFGYCVFKLIFQNYYYLANEALKFTTQDDSRTFAGGAVWPRSWFMFRKVDYGRSLGDKASWYNDTLLCNFILLLSSAACVYSSYTFKFEMRNAEKSMTLKIINFFSILSKVFLGALLLKVTFIDDNKCIGLIFLLVLLFDIGRVMYLIIRQKSSGNKIELKDYVVTLKWLSFGILCLLIIGSFWYGFLRRILINSMPTGSSPSEAFIDLADWYIIFCDYFMLYLNPDQYTNPRKSTFIVVYMLLGSIIVLEFLSKVEAGASLDIFDIHLFQKIQLAEPGRGNSDEDTDMYKNRVPSDSLMVTYFIDNVFGIMKIKEENIFTKSFDFQTDYVKKMRSESLAVSTRLDKIKNQKLGTLNKRTNLVALIADFLRWLQITILVHLLSELEYILRLAINIYSMYCFLFYVRWPSFNPLLVYTLLIWNIFSMVSQSPKFMMWATVILIYPFYFFDYVNVSYKALAGSKSKNTIMSPLSIKGYFTVAIMTTAHLGMTLINQIENQENSAFHKFINSMKQRKQLNNEKFYSLSSKVYDLIRIRFNKVFRFLPILLGVLTCLHSINLLNGTLLLVTLFFIGDKERDKKYWGYYNGFIVFLLLIRQIGNYTLNLQHYNAEFLALLGVVTIDENVEDKFAVRGLMVFNFFLVFFACSWYKRMNIRLTVQNLFQKEEDERKLNALNELSIVKKLWSFYKLFSMIFKYYSVWIYHISANLILLTDTRDILSVTFIFSECVIALVHIIIWNRQGQHPYKKVYKVWIISFYMVVFYCLCRYSLFFLKYTSVEYWYKALFAESMTQEIDRHFFKSVKHIPASEQHNVETFISLFTRPMMLLTVAVLTRETLLNYLEKIEEEEKRLKPPVTNQPNKTDNLAKSQIDTIAVPTLPIGISVSNVELASPAKDENDVEPESDSPRFISPVSITAYSPKKSAPPKDPNNSKEPVILAEDLSSFSRQTNPFLVTYLIFKGVFLGFVMKYFHVNMNVFKLFMVACYLMNMRTLFSNLISLCDRMQLIHLFTLRSKYFYYTFLTDKKCKDNFKDEKELTKQNDEIMKQYTDEVQKKDLAQNKMYYQQFMVRMELILFKVNRIFWGLTFFPLLFLSSLIVVVNYFMRNSEVVSKYYLEFIFGISPGKWLDEQEINNELLGIQIVITGLFIEYMLTSYYLDCRKTLSEIDEARLTKLLECLEVKYKFLVDVRTELVPRERFEDRLKTYIQAVRFSPDAQSPNRSPSMSTVPDPNREGFPEEVNTAEYSDKEKTDSEEDEEENSSEELVVSEEEEDSSSHSAETQKPDSNARASVGDQDYFKKIFKLLSSENSSSIYYMTEKTSREDLLLFMYRNKYKYYALKVFESLLYIFTRLGAIPILLPITSKLNFLTIGFYIYFLIQSMKTKRTFMEDIANKNTTGFLFLILQTLHEFVHNRLMANTNGGYRSFFDGKSLAAFHHLLKPIEGETFRVCFYWLFISSLGFALLPIFVWISTKVLFREKLDKKSTYYFHLYDRNRKKHIVIDYSKWRKGALSILNLPYKTVYISSLDMHSTLIVIGIILFWKDVYILLFLLTLAVSAYENFKSEQTDTGNSVRKRYLDRLIKVYTALYWGMFAFYHLIELMGKLNFSKEYSMNPTAYMENINPGTISVILICLTGIYQDFIDTVDYFSIYQKLKNESDLKIRYANLCKAYDMNEHKIYCRTIEMMKKREIDEFSNQILSRKDLAKIPININYMQKSIEELLRESSDILLEKYTGFVKRMWMKMIRGTYETIIEGSNSFRYQDIWFLFENVRNRNKSVLAEVDINLEDCFDQNYNIFFKRFTEVTIYYHGLRDGDVQKVKLSDERYAEFLAKNYTNLLGKFIDLNIKELTMSSQLAGDLNLGSSSIHSRRRAVANMKKPADISVLPKSKVALQNAANILVNNLTMCRDPGVESKTLLENYMIEFNRCGYLNCSFNKTKVVLYNIRSDEISATAGYYKFNWGVISKYIFRYLNTHSEYLVSLVLIGMHILYGGVANLIVVGILIFTVFIEETTGRSFWWRILYSMFLFILLFKQTYKVNRYLKTNPILVEFFFGEMTSMSDIISVLLSLYMIGFLKKFSVENKSAVDFENPGLAMCRLAINGGFDELCDRYCQATLQKKEQLNMNISTVMSRNNNDAVLANDFKMVLIRQVVKNYSQITNFKNEFLHTIQKLLRVTKNDIHKVNPRDMENFWFRNFSTFMQKSGHNYNGMASMLLIVMIVYVLLFFPTLSSEKNKIASFIFEDKVTAFTVINFAIYLTFFILHYYIDQMKSHDRTGLCTREYTLSLLSDFDAKVNSNSKPTMLEILRSAGNKVKTMMTLRNNIASVDNTTAHRANPLFYLFLFSVVLWVYVNYSVFFWHTVHGNLRAPEKEGLFQFICEAKDKEGDLGERNKKPCQKYSENIHSMIFYTLNILYLIICMLQIRDGKILHESKITDFKNKLNMILYKIYAATPLVRETRIAFEYCATKTTLLFSDFTLVKEIEFVLQDAKMLHQANMEDRTGKTMARMTQNIICIVVLLVVVAMFALPMYLFYNSNNRSYYDILSASISVDMFVGSQKITNLFFSSKLKTNQPLLNVPGMESTVDRLQKYNNMRKYDRSQFMVD